MGRVNLFRRKKMSTNNNNLFYLVNIIIYDDDDRPKTPEFNSKQHLDQLLKSLR